MFSEDNWTHSDLETPIALYSSKPLASLVTDRPLILIGGVHGDEPLGVELAEQTLEFLREDGRGPALVKLPWVLIPILNVDGFERGTRVNGRGVDLNRNYPSRCWSSEYSKERYYPGPKPGSEAEIKALVKLIADLQPRLIIHCHSWKPMIVVAGEPGHRDAQRLAHASGYEISPDIGYPTPGSLSQYGWEDHRIPVICIEEADETQEGKVWSRFAEGMREIFLDASAR